MIDSPDDEHRGAWNM